MNFRSQIKVSTACVSRAGEPIADCGFKDKSCLFSNPNSATPETRPAYAGGSDTLQSTQSAIKTFVSPRTLALRLEAKTRRLPSGENIGKPSKVS